MGVKLVVYLRLLCAKDFNINDLNEVLKEKGERTFYVMNRKNVHAWGSKPYGGRIELRPWKTSSVIDVSIRGKQENRLTGSFIEWILRNIPNKAFEITVYASY
jgi:hypothetical protein